MRDLALWFSRKNPFAPDQAPVDPENWQKSLESFLAAQVRHHSGGLSFSVGDLHSIAKLSAVLIVLDGFDEVADIPARHVIVEEITRGINRLEGTATSLQVVVTSRPAAFANSPGFSESVFRHFELRSVSREQIDAYAEKWMDARHLNGRHRAEFKAILIDKLNQPHLRDLARNPMQLAILLSLIHTRGASLPDKRTNLYDSYMELFFSRESEKSDIVREYRDLLIDIHRYLAWKLHADAEIGANRGSITSARLHEVLVDYLAREGHDTRIASVLFAGMVERVVALVSRVEGTYEFEVQPLREYFAARFLYETAPYSPPGDEKRGTKPDRFDVIARNFYWLNVTRFYAGCFSKGELASLVECLEALASSEGYQYIKYPRMLAAMLLSDWVFTQQPKSLHKVVEFVLDARALKLLLASRPSRGMQSEPISLPEKCGRNELVGRCFHLLRSGVSRDFAYDLIQLARANCDRYRLVESFKSAVEGTTGTQRSRWLEYARVADVLADLNESELANLFVDDDESHGRVAILLAAGRFEFCARSAPRMDKALDLILKRRFSWLRSINAVGREETSLLGRIAGALDIRRYAAAFSHPYPVSLRATLRRYPTGMQVTKKGAELVGPPEIKSFVLHAERLTERSSEEWSSSLEPWDELIEAARSLWGDKWTIFCLATVAAGIKSKAETAKGFDNLFDHRVPLCGRVRHARLRSGAVRWWQEQFDRVSSDLDAVVAALVLLTWGTSKTLTALVPKLEYVFERMSQPAFGELIAALSEVIPFSRPRSSQSRLVTFNMEDLPRSMNSRLATALSRRARDASALAIYSAFLSRYEGNDSVIWARCQELSLQAAAQGAKKWEDTLKVVRDSYSHDGIGQPFLGDPDLPQKVAGAVCKAPLEYPGYLVARAEARYSQYVASQVTAVGKTAEAHGWLSEA